jgi:Suppressor of fused protein (SUFU)
MPMKIEEYRSKYSAKDAAPGWEAIDRQLRTIYSTQEPKHFLGGGAVKNDMLDGVSMYQSQASGVKHQHFISYGFSNLYYDEEAVGGEFSRFGFELTFRLRPFKLDGALPYWVQAVMQNIARYVFKSGNWFEEYHFMPAGGPIRIDAETDLTAIAFVTDPELGVIDTPHGQVRFLQMFGITTQEFERLKADTLTCEQLFADEATRNPLWITDLERKSA